MRLTVSIRRSDMWIAVCAVGLTLLYIVSAGGGFPLDDSWIHQTYGRNLAQLGEWAFTPGIPSTASTSPLYTVLLAAGYRLGVSHTVWTHGWGILCLIAAGWVGARMGERLIPHNRSIGLYTGLALVSAWHLLWAAASGMETMIFSSFTLVLIWLGWRELDETRTRTGRAFAARGALFGFAAALTVLARPEGLLLVGLIGLALMIIRPHMRCSDMLVWGTSAAFVFAIVLTPYLTFNLQTTGGLLPNTAASKRADLEALFEAPYLQRVVSLLVPLSAGGQVLLVPGAVFFAAGSLHRPRRDRRALFSLVPLAWSIGLILLYAAYLPAYFQHGRYVIPALPAFIVCGVAGTVLLVQRARRSLISRVFARVLVLAAAAVFALFALLIGRAAYVEDVSIIDTEMVRTAHWIAETLPPEHLLAIHDIGAVGYFASRPILDLAGLVNPELLPIIPIERNAEATWQMLRERDARYMMGFADQLPGANPLDPRLCPIYRARGTEAEVSTTFNMSVYRIAWDEDCDQPNPIN